MEAIAIVLMLILFGISLLHFYWAFGGFWPGHDAGSLANTVIGIEGMKEIPSMVVTCTVAVGIFIAGTIPLMWCGLIPYPFPQSLVWLAM